MTGIGKRQSEWVSVTRLISDLSIADAKTVFQPVLDLRHARTTYTQKMEYPRGLTESVHHGMQSWMYSDRAPKLDGKGLVSSVYRHNAGKCEVVFVMLDLIIHQYHR